MVKLRLKNDGLMNSSNKMQKMLGDKKFRNLEKYAQEGVEALKNATPRDTGKTAEAWNYKIIRNKRGVTIVWTNSNIQDGYSVAVLIQYGHATKSGVFIQGVDYINPAMEPIIDKITKKVWEEVKR